MKIRILFTAFYLLITINMAFSQQKINITIDGRSASATLADNVATKALVSKLKVAPITITMNNYGGFEKVGELPWSLPSSDTRITTKPGDIMLYTSNNIVIFYGENTWSYTPLGTLDETNPSAISSFVGSGTKQVTISLMNNAGVEDVAVTADTDRKVYSLEGRLVHKRPLAPGVYIIDNNKVIIK